MPAASHPASNPAASTTTAGSSGTLLGRIRTSIDTVYREAVKFGTVGALAFVVDIGLFNLLRVGGHGGLDDKPLTAKTISVFVATVVAWLGNRYWTFRHRRRASARREFLLFGIMNVGGLAIALACLGFSHYVLGQTSALADNIAGNVVGLGLGTLFRFWAYRRLVFTEELSDLLDDKPPVTTPVATREIVATKESVAIKESGSIKEIGVRAAP